SLNFSTELKSVWAEDSIEPFCPAADSSKSGRPTSPTKTKSPERIPIGLSVAALSVTRNEICSGVWPGVNKILKLIFPILNVSPSFTSSQLYEESCNHSYFQFSSPSSDA